MTRHPAIADARAYLAQSFPNPNRTAPTSISGEKARHDQQLLEATRSQASALIAVADLVEQMVDLYRDALAMPLVDDPDDDPTTRTAAAPVALAPVLSMPMRDDAQDRKDHQL